MLGSRSFCLGKKGGKSEHLLDENREQVVGNPHLEQSTRCEQRRRDPKGSGIPMQIRMSLSGNRRGETAKPLPECKTVSAHLTESRCSQKSIV